MRFSKEEEYLRQKDKKLKKIIDNNTKSLIEKEFESEMKELKYLRWFIH